MRVISPSCPSKANLALYNSTSGSVGGGGGTGARLGGSGGWRAVVLVVAEVTFGFIGADTLVFPGNGFAAGLGLEAPVGFWCKPDNQSWSIRTEEIQWMLTEGPPALGNFPCVIGFTTPGFFLGTGLETLLGGSPDGT